MIQHNTDESWNPVLSMAVSEDNYGASVGFYIGKWDYGEDPSKWNGWNHGYGVGLREWKLWFKPIDVLKFDIGRIDQSTNQESIDYDTRLMNYDEWGYRVGYSANNLTINLAFHQDQGQFWFSQAANGDAITKGLNLYASYGADFGTILAFVDFNNTFLNINAGVGYSKSFGDMSVFFDAGMFYAGVKGGEGAFGFGVDADFKYAKDAIDFQAYVRWVESNFKSLGKEGDPMYLYFKTKFQYHLDPCTLFVYFKDENFMAKKFAAKIQAGANGSVGAASWKVYAEIETGKGANGDKLNFAIPVEFAVAF